MKFHQGCNVMLNLLRKSECYTELNKSFYDKAISCISDYYDSYI